MTAHGAGFDNLLDRCLAVRVGEQVVLLTDEGTDDAVVAGLEGGIARRGAVPVRARMPLPESPGAEPPSAVASMMLEAGAVIELTSLFIGLSRARQRATRAGVRYLAMPGVRLDTFRDDGPLTVDFDTIRSDAEQIGAAWSGAERFRLTSAGGTDLRGSVAGRPGRVLHGLAREDAAYMAPPDIEAGTAPVEGTASGVVVVDADLLFMGQGPLSEPVIIQVEDGEMVALEGPEAGRLQDMLARCADERMRNVAEVSSGVQSFGSGLAWRWRRSPRAARHTSHSGTPSPTEGWWSIADLDCVMRDATLEVDGRPVMVSGELV